MDREKILAGAQRFLASFRSDHLSKVWTKAQHLLSDPESCWPALLASVPPFTILLLDYVAVIAGISAVGSFLGLTLVGIDVPVFGRFRVSVLHALMSAFYELGMSFVAVYAGARVIQFIGEKCTLSLSFERSAVLVAYSLTPAWIGRIFLFVPVLGVLGYGGLLYAGYLLYLGIEADSEIPASRRLLIFCGTAASLLTIIYFFATIVSGMRPAPSIPGY